MPCFKETLIYIGHKRVSSAAIFFDTNRKTEIIKENIYSTCGKKLLVTDANPIKRTVYTLNNKSASSEYAKALEISEAELPKYFENNPLGKMYKNDIFIASPMKVNSDKSITFYCQVVLPNTFVQVLIPVDPMKKIKETFKSIPFKPQFTYVINCILRSSKFNKEGLWKNIDKEIIDVCDNTTGFVSYGEQFYKHHVNQTMVILAIELIGVIKLFNSNDNFNYLKGVFLLNAQINKDFDSLLKEESSITHGLSMLSDGLGFTTMQINEVNELLIRLSQNSERTKDCVDKVFDNLKQSSNEIVTAKNGIENVVCKMVNVTDVFNKFYEVFIELHSQYKNLSNFANIINDIADETNLLSLNASIEAARGR